MVWGVTFMLLWMGRVQLLHLPDAAPLICCGVVVAYAHLRQRISTYLKVGVGLLFLGNEYVGFAYAVSLVPVAILMRLRQDYVVSGPQRWLWRLLAWCFFVYLLSLHREWNPGAFPTYLVTFGSSMVLFALAVQIGHNADVARGLIQFLGICLLWQSFLVVTHGVMNGWLGDPGDWVVGSTRQPEISFAFATGLFCGIGSFLTRREAVSIQSSRALFRHRGVTVAFVLLMGWMLHLTHTRILNYSVLSAMGLGLPSLLAVGPMARVVRRKWLGAVGAAMALMAGFLLWDLVTVPSTSFGDTGMVYVRNPSYNHKAVFLRRALGDIPNVYGTWLTGTGPGTVGTRAANSRAYDTLYKPQGARVPSWIRAYTSGPAREYFVDLYQSSFVEMTGKSQTLASPFSSVISIFVELGLVGALLSSVVLCLLLRCFVRLTYLDREPIYQTLGIALLLYTLTLAMASFLDTMLERPLMMMPYWIFSGIAVGRLRLLSVEVRDTICGGSRPGIENDWPGKQSLA